MSSCLLSRHLPHGPRGSIIATMDTRTLRKGWTTGACACAAARAAWQALLTGTFPDPVTIALPGDVRQPFALARRHTDGDTATAAVIKDAGDDPDVTHQAEIIATVRRGAPGSGVQFKAGPGVGTVTLPGLPLTVGEPAINPGPRGYISANLQELSSTLGAACDIEVTVAITNGETLAAKTMNPRLGILGGLSVLGTTGVVIPYSCAAWIASIHRGVDVARAAGLSHVAGTTGRTSEKAVQTLHGLPDQAMLDMGDFAGGLLKYLRRHPLPRLTIGGGFAKLSKLAFGQMDLHSSRTSVDFARLAALLEDLGAPPDAVSTARTATATGTLLDIATAHNLPLAEVIARRAREATLAVLSGDTLVDVCVFDRQGRLLAHAR